MFDQCHRGVILPPAESGGGTPAFVGGTVVWRVVVVVASGSLAQETNIKARTESIEPSMIARFIALTYN